MKIEIKREWAKNTHVSKKWFKKGTLAKHRLYFYWSDQKEFPCDKYGFRLPSNLLNFEDRYTNDKNKKIFCFGGSTTWGQFCEYKNTYPFYLEKILNNDVSVYNFGGCDSDARTQIYILIDLLRKKYNPDLVLFLDGINEKTAWLNKINNLEYNETNLHYNYFKFLDSNFALYYKFKEFIKFSIKKSIEGGLPLKSEGIDPMTYVSELSNSYLNSINFVDKLKDVFKFKFFSFLQPIVYDIIENNPDRYLHIKGFYNNVKLSRYKNIIDISKSTNLVKENFIDWQHLDGDGNKKIAETIFEKIKNEI